MGNAWTKSNGHGEGKEESMNLVDTIKSLQKDVQIYKVDKERLIKYKENQYEFYINLLQRLDKTKKKMDKETKSSKSVIHRSHDKRRPTKSVDRNHNHSPRNSTRRAHSCSSPSPIRKNKRRYRVDDLQGDMDKILTTLVK
jgi:hypothetical protein